MKKAVVFDLDGTLLNTLEDLCDSTNYALEEVGFPARTIEEVRRFVGNGIRKLIERAVPDTATAEQTEACYQIFCEHYKHNMENKTAEYDGISDMLAALRDAGYRLAIVTNKADFAAQALCGSLFGKYAKTVVGSVDVRPNKPAPNGVFYANRRRKNIGEYPRRIKKYALKAKKLLNLVDICAKIVQNRVE